MAVMPKGAQRIAQPEPTPTPTPLQVPPNNAQLDVLRNAAQRLQVRLDDATAQRLLDYLALLQRWNQVYNLTALRDPAQMLSHHLLDCLAVLPALERHLGNPAGGTAKTGTVTILDVGSGGGLPGVVLAIIRPDWRVDCVDTVAKKAGFIRQVALDLRLPNLHGLHARVESLVAQPRRYDLVVARAFASLVDFTRLSAAVLAQHGVWVAMKAKLPEEEQAALPSSVAVFHVEQLQVPGLEAQRCLVWMRPLLT